MTPEARRVLDAALADLHNLEDTQARLASSARFPATILAAHAGRAAYREAAAVLSEALDQVALSE